MLTLTKLLQDSVDKVFEDDKSNLFTATLSIRNYNDRSFEIPSVKIDMIKIHQLFSQNVTDDLQVNVNIQPEELLQLVKYQNALYAVLTIDYIEWESGNIILDETPESYTYRVFIHDLENLAKRFNISAFLNIDDPSVVMPQTASSIIDITLQLISDESYQLNKAAFVGFLSNTTVEKAIKFIASNMGIKRINMIPAHNTANIHRLYIPPQHASFQQVFTYIQQRYGVYTEGLSYYLTAGVLYVYPQYAIDIDRPKKLRILKINPNAQMGLPNYFIDSDDIITIVSNTEIVHKAISNAAIENDGNSQVYISADKVIDGQVSVSEHSITLNDINRACTNNVNNGIASESAIPRFKGSTINMFHEVSNISATNTEIIITGWLYARLFILTPGMPVEYIYDEEDRTVMVTGILESISFDMLRMQGTHGGVVPYNLNASLMLRLDLDSNKTELTTL